MPHRPDHRPRPFREVCNYYFLVEGENGEREGKEWTELESKIKQLNKAFKSATPEALGRIAKEGMVLAVAGGSHKAYSILHVLRNSRERTWITHLVTDQVTAQWILQKEKAPAAPAGSSGTPGEATSRLPPQPVGVKTAKP